MKKIYLILGLCLLLSGCGGGVSGTGGGTSGGGTEVPTKLDVKAGKDFELDKNGVVYLSEMAFTAPGKAPIKSSSHYLFFANFELDASNPREMRKDLTTPDQTRVEIQLTGEDGTKTDSPFKVGTYSALAENVNGVRLVRISTFADGKQTQTDFKVMNTSKKATGDLKITAVTADSVSGEINVTDGAKSIKGTFTAKLPTPKK